MKKKYLKVSNCLLAGLLALLGYSCKESGGDVDEYGTPTATYCIKGKVVDYTTKEPLHGMKVVVAPDRNEGEYFSKDTLTTPADGTFEKDFDHIFPCKEFKVVAEDSTGDYAKDSTLVTITQDDFIYTSNGHWDSGTAVKKVTVTMKKTPKK